MDLGHYWQYTDMVTKTLCFILFALSMASWVVGILRIIHSRQLGERVVSELTEHIQRTLAPLTQLSLDSKKTVVEQTLLQQLSRYRFDSEQGLSVLGTTAAIAPFIGLFGTVWGIFHALNSIPHCQNSCHPHPNNPNGGKGDNHGTIQCRTQTSNIKQTFIT